MNISNYFQTSVVYASTSAQPGTTGQAVAQSTALGFPTGSTILLDMSGFEGAIATLTVTNSTFAALQPFISNTSTFAAATVTSSGWAVSVSTANAGYSTAFYSLSYDLYRPSARYVGFYGSIPTTSGVITAITVQQYGPKREPTALGTSLGGSTIFVSPSTF